MSHSDEQLLVRLNQLKTERNAVILAHNYQPEAIQDIADYVGDSLDLSRVAADTDAEVIVMCGVHFMAEGAAILAPEKIVLLPDPGAGCPLADMVTVDRLRKEIATNPGALVVTYINSSAAVKAESHICVTSSNAVKVVNSLPTDEILFVPDMNLGRYVANRTGKRVRLWQGYCPTHHCVTAEDVLTARRTYPQAAIVVHPECREEVCALADEVASTGGILQYARDCEHEQLVIGTETGLLYRLKKENPNKTFHLLHPGLVCPNMKRIDLASVERSLLTLEPRITVPPDTVAAARRALERMLAVS